MVQDIGVVYGQSIGTKHTIIGKMALETLENLKKMNVEDERNHGEDSIGCASWSLDVRRSKVDRDRNR
ncbi:unnamed protein product [Caenorhabditis angaria]|uniref:Uncharacterized protein n=1 Tax=Caenorhabditis angaria TaxID=860376 RepID=A0A9P1I741_9PELO|nr:unnamed protein product [Caenorhabditis angaria]CAI5442462.1 unnamed protein product [Caenorhabditis angaria]CAI5444974.1 unnamed protein product [Caenorhabditis angaria]